MVFLVWDSPGGGGRQYRSGLLDAASAACKCRALLETGANAEIVVPCRTIRKLGQVNIPEPPAYFLPLTPMESVCALLPS